jgi:hypothetical protein
VHVSTRAVFGTLNLLPTTALVLVLSKIVVVFLRLVSLSAGFTLAQATNPRHACSWRSSPAKSAATDVRLDDTSPFDPLKGQ